MIKKAIVKYRKLLCLLFSLLGLVLVFVGGAFSSNTKLETIADYASEVARNHTNDSNLFAITAEKTPESGAIVDSDSEFHNLYGTFRQEKITFASVINADKRHDIILEDNLSNSLSMLYLGPAGTVPYNGHFKHYTYPIEVMFLDEKLYDLSKYVVYISQNHADSILEMNGVLKQDDGSYTENDYKSLQKQPISIYVDGTAETFLIQNIYYQSNYYYNGLSSVVGDFVMVSYYLPFNLRGEQQNMYFMSEYSYQNKYFMKYINNVYSSKKYLVKVNSYNISGDIDEDFLINFYYSDLAETEWLFPLFIVLSSLFLLFSLCTFFIDKEHQKKSYLFTFLYFLSLLIPYSLFSIIYRLTSNIAIFSEVSTKAYTIIVLIYLFINVGISLYSKYRGDSILAKGLKGSMYEISI